MNEEMIGQSLGRYRVVRVIGKGGMGIVFEGERTDIGGRVAVKLLHPEFARDPEIATRFFNEARAVNLIEHPSIVRIFDYGTLADGRAFLAMEYLDGEPLSSRIHRLQTLSVAETLRLGRQIASALAATHEKRVIHRDLKPSNVMIVRDPEAAGGERAKILDFGIAKLGEQSGGGVAQTRPGALLGTPQYMSPEQCRGSVELTDRTDVYALAVMLFEMLTGGPPFVAEGQGDLIAKHMFTEPPSLSSVLPSAPTELSSLIAAMLSKQPADRPAMLSVAEELQRIGEMRAQSAPQGSLVSTPLETTQERRPFTTNELPPTLSPNIEPPHLEPPRSVAEPRVRPPGSKRLLTVVASLGTLLVLGGVTAVVLRGSKPSPTGESSGEPLLRSVQQAMADHRWPIAVDKANQVLAIPGISDETKRQAISARELAEQEERNRLVFQEFERVANDSQYELAITAFGNLPTDSVYRRQGLTTYELSKARFIDQRLAAANKARAIGRCSEMNSALARVLAVDPAQREALALRALPCSVPTSPEVLPTAKRQRPQEERSSTVSARLSDGQETHKSDPVPTPGGSSQTDPALRKRGSKALRSAPGDEEAATVDGAASSSTESSITATNSSANPTSQHVEQVLQDAQTDFVNGKFQSALSKAQSVASANPTRAWRMIGASACNLRMPDLAKRALAQLDSSGRQYVIYVCKRLEINLVGTTLQMATPTTEAAEPRTAEQVLQEAEADFKSGNYRSAVVKAGSVTSKNPGVAWRIIGASACQLRDLELATQAYAEMNSSGQRFLVSRCQSAGVVLVGSAFQVATPSSP